MKNQIISEWSAKNIYKVSYDKESLKINSEETKKLREEERKSRIRRGKPFQEFIKEWEKKKPPEEVLKYYGSWPDAKPIAPLIRP